MKKLFLGMGLLVFSLVVGASSASAVVGAEVEVKAGCEGRTTGFSAETGKPCLGAIMSAAAKAAIAGCADRTTGFSTEDGRSCVGNIMSATARQYNFGNSTLRNGSRGEAAKELQRFLNARLNLGLMLDGIIGPKTIAVIRKWQAERGLVADGLVGPKTKARMQVEAEAEMESSEE
ncbi:MAG: peptidoglycan-binding domain-containing protein [Candidatus Paceibacterota bacterium]